MPKIQPPTKRAGDALQGLTVKVTFALPADAAAGVSVLGDFNGWDPSAHPLKKRSNGTRSVSVELPAGSTYHYKFLTADGTWFCDPNSDAVVLNEFHQPNSVLSV